MQVGRQFIGFFNSKTNKNKRIPRYKDRNGHNVVTFPKTTISRHVDFDEGRQIRRGLYRDGKGNLWNADLNGAANIMRKVVSDKAYKGIRKTKELMKRPILVTL